MWTKITGRSVKASGVVLRVRIVCLLAALCSCPAVMAQTNSFHDGGTPAESKQGATAAASYDRERVETVNLANGNFSMGLPLASVGGRGSASYALSLSYNSKLWSATHEAEKVPGCMEWGGTCAEDPTVHHFSAVYDVPSMARPNSVALGGGWSILKGPYVKRSHPSVLIDPIPCPSGGTLTACYKYALTKAWLLLPDGSEVELRDALTDGAPYLLPTPATSQLDRGRGRVWQSRDGSNVTYVTDAPNGVVTGQFSGWVFLADGTRLRMEGQRATKIVDRHGNYVTIDYGTTGAVTYTDPLGRQTILQTVATGATVTVKGYGGAADRVITVDTGVIGALDASGVASNLRSDFRSLARPFTGGDAFRDQNGLTEHTIGTPHTDLFPGSEGGDNVDGARAVTRLGLPDGRSLRFRYNQYGEVAEVVYPGGGASRVDYEGFRSRACEGYEPFSATLNRRAVKRQSLANGSAPDATWDYSYSFGGADPHTTVEARQGDGQPADALLMSEKHFFLAVDAEYRVCRPTASNGTFYEKWENAKVHRVERQTGAGTRVTTRLWQQRATVAWGNDPGLTYNTYAAAHGQEQPPNDPRVLREDTTLENGRRRYVEYSYDRFNNVTSVREFDFVTATAPAVLLRQTARRYAGGGADLSINGHCYTNLDPLDDACGAGLAADPATIIHQKSLLLSEAVKDGAGTQLAYAEYEYDQYLGDGNRAPLATNAGMIRYDGARFSGFAAGSQPRGNVTRVARWLGGTTYAYSYNRYDNAGNVVSVKDPRGFVSTLSYADNFGAGTNPDAGVAGTNGATFAFPTLQTNALGHQSKTQYSYNYDAPTGVKDANGTLTRTDYDTLGRPVRVTAAVGLAVEAVTETAYPTATVNATHTSSKLDATRWVSARTQFDGFGRPAVSSASEDGKHYATAAFSLHTKTVYDALGRPGQVSNPYRTGQTPVYAATGYDLLGRVTSVTTPDGAKVLTAYDGEAVMVTDQAGKKRISRTDALGRLADVWEVAAADASTVAVTFGGVTHNGYRTTYRYDVLDNLRKVEQGAQSRFFAYDALSRLVRAKNPEQGAMASDADFPALTDSTSGTANGQWSLGYKYDAGGNLTKRKDARNVTAAYGYDALNRNTAVAYSDSTPDVTRSYDGATLGKGRPWKSEAAATSLTTTSEYDALGRPERQQQQFWAGAAWGASFGVTRAYDRAGNVLTQTYPSGRKATYTYDGAGRLASFTGTLGDGAPRTYSTGITYHESGGVSRETFGTATTLYNRRFYNVRGQLSEVRLGTYHASDAGWWNRGAILNVYSDTAGWTESEADNNGNLRKQMVFVPSDDAISGWWQTNFFYQYDSLNRLALVREVQDDQNQWLLDFDYDRFGNRTVNAAGTKVVAPGATYSIPEPQFIVNAANNRLAPPAGYTMAYDAAGNLTQDTYTGGGTRTFDAESRMRTAQFVSGQLQTATYTYDADGRRVKRDAGAAAEVWQVYGMGGELLAEYAAGAAPASPQKEYGYRAGELLVTLEAGQRVNVALSSNGAVATASSQLDTTRLPSAAINGDRRGLHWGSDPTSGSGWTDATPHAFPDWLEVTFAGSKTIDEIGVVGLQDNYTAPVEPTEALTSAAYTLTAFTVQYWTGAAWATVPGGGVTGNTKVWRKFTFAPVTTQKIRVVVGAAASGAGRLVELEAWGAGADARWLVTDHLGTPRMVADASGQLSGISRHDYLPFGEEVGAGVGGRTTGRGYSQPDGLRQRFTSQERDDETELDYFGARYYSSPQGRFTSPDPLLASGTIYDPQTWNRYTYALNNPTKFTDPTGLYVFSAALGGNLTDDELRAGATTKKRRKEVEKIIKQRDQFRDALDRARAAANAASLTPDQRAAAQRAVNSYGEFNDGKHDNVVVGLVKNKNASSSADGNNPDGNIYVNLNLRRSDRNSSVTVAHEGSHVADFQDWLGHRGGPEEEAYDITQYETESRAFFVSSYVAQGLGLKRYYPGGDKCTEVWNKGWKEQQREAYRAVGVGTYIWKNYNAHPNGGKLAPNNPGFTLSTSP